MWLAIGLYEACHAAVRQCSRSRLSAVIAAAQLRNSGHSADGLHLAKYDEATALYELYIFYTDTGYVHVSSFATTHRDQQLILHLLVLSTHTLMPCWQAHHACNPAWPGCTPMCLPEPISHSSKA